MTGLLRVAGTESLYWSRDGGDTDNAYRLYANAFDSEPSDGPRRRYYGFSLRCLQE